MVLRVCCCGACYCVRIWEVSFSSRVTVSFGGVACGYEGGFSVGLNRYSTCTLFGKGGFMPSSVFFSFAIHFDVVFRVGFLL